MGRPFRRDVEKSFAQCDGLVTIGGKWVKTRIRPIVQIGHPVLRTPARRVSREELLDAATQTFIDQLIATMRHAHGAGLAANQVNHPVRICALEVADNPRYPYKPNIPLTVLVNPVVTPLGDDVFGNYEGCLSVPNLRGVVSRHARARVTAWDRHGNEIDVDVAGISAGTYQHEVDHLDGVLFVDRVTDPTTLCTWDEFNLRHKESFVAEVQALVRRYGS